jgi:ATP-dependent RNA helicase RhlE
MFSNLGLNAALAKAVAEQGYTTPTPIQLRAIPALLEGRDVLAAAQTGTGKTAAFALPMLQRLSAATSGVANIPLMNPRDNRRNAGPRRPPRALIMTPTRELAAQVGEDLRIYGRHLPLRSTTIYGGVGFGPQIDAVRRGVDIVIATPGRLLDHVSQRTIDLSRIEIVVLDEADRMLDMGFIHDIKRILQVLPAKRQSLLFSATFSDEIRRIAAAFLSNPLEIEVAARNTPAELVNQRIHWVDKERKRELLSHLIREGAWSQTLVFARTKHGADRLAQQLERDGHAVAAIHGDKSQGQRMRALEDFKRGRVHVLVATDVASRGIDIDALPHVVNFELPHVPEDYVHRIGRTGRAGNTGEAVSLVSAEERDQLRDIQRLLRKDLPATVVDGFAPSVKPEDVRQTPRPGSRAPRSAGPGAGRPSHGPRPSQRPGQRPAHSAGHGAGQRPAATDRRDAAPAGGPPARRMRGAGRRSSW